MRWVHPRRFIHPELYVTARDWVGYRIVIRASDDEAVVFSWIEWPDKATRDAAMSRLEDCFLGRTGRS